MNKTILAAAIALAVTAPVAVADTCAGLAARLNSTNAMLRVETGNILRTAAMIDASVELGDLNTGMMHIEMAKSSVISGIGLLAETRSIVAEAKAKPGMCGASNADYANMEAAFDKADAQFKVFMSTYKNLNK